jgi:hypothetical protein
MKTSNLTSFKAFAVNNTLRFKLMGDFSIHTSDMADFAQNQISVIENVLYAELDM